METFINDTLFLVLAGVTVIASVLVVITENIVRAACWLLLALTGAAGLFFFMGADFVGATQLLIYVGGTLVLVIFGVMLTATGPYVRLRGYSTDWAVAIIGGFCMIGLIVYSMMATDGLIKVGKPQPRTTVATTNEIGRQFLGIGSDKPMGTVINESDENADGESEDSTMPTRRIKNVQMPEKGVNSYLLPFEIVSLHLVVVLIGAAYLARAKRRANDLPKTSEPKEASA